MATASGNSEGRHKPIMPLVAYGVVLALLVAAGAIVFAAGGSKGNVPAGTVAARAPPPAVADASTARALKLPPRPSPSEKAAPEKAAPEKAAPEKAVTETAVAPAPASASLAEAEKKPEPLKIETAKGEAPKTEATKTELGKAACKVDLTRWPTDKSDQAQAVQMLLRDLGYYRGTTNGTVGPQTRTAIREFQLASGEADTGEVSEALFEQLKKKCAASTRAERREERCRRCDPTR